MPSGTHPEEPEDTASQMENADTGEIPVHPDDRLWRHPSELARMRQAGRETVTAPVPTPIGARQERAGSWISRIPTSLVIAAGIAAVVASVGSVVALAQSPSATARVTIPPGPHAPVQTATIVSGSASASGLMVDPQGLALVATTDPPATATLETGRRRTPARLRAFAPDLGLAAYQVVPPENAATTTALMAPATTTALVHPSGNWTVPHGSSDLNLLAPRLLPSTWGPMLMTHLSGAPAEPGTPLAEGGTVVGMSIVTTDDRSMVIPWPMLRALGARLQAAPRSMGDLPANLSDDGSSPMLTDEWSDGSLQTGDRVEAIDGLAVSSAAEVRAIAAIHFEGTTAMVRCERSAKSVTVDVALE